MSEIASITQQSDSQVRSEGDNSRKELAPSAEIKVNLVALPMSRLIVLFDALSPEEESDDLSALNNEQRKAITREIARRFQETVNHLTHLKKMSDVIAQPLPGAYDFSRLTGELNDRIRAIVTHEEYGDPNGPLTRVMNDLKASIAVLYQMTISNTGKKYEDLPRIDELSLALKKMGLPESLLSWYVFGEDDVVPASRYTSEREKMKPTA